MFKNVHSNSFSMFPSGMVHYLVVFMVIAVCVGLYIYFKDL